ncbi:benomyl methotrexate resistance [Pyrenophora seminiperda CCB06]|uniref:Benomyl methotrexate resistance n=1 Tax=Pyrenophora seminiperda CCB06 TaxID=1302712 RepID=A0A3M7M2V4_9PLEO|nr:benomyl methotrexate resistance [Pyrenophora seminiperda CCB06]
MNTTTGGVSMSSAQEAHADSGSSGRPTKDDFAYEADEEKAMGFAGAGNSSTEEQSVGVTGMDRSRNRRSQDNRSLKTVRSHHSRAGGDGYTCLDAEANNHGPHRAKSGPVTEQPYLVTWDGDADPENPRSMSKLRRWAIVLICAASSLCVTCTSSLYTSTYSQLEPEFGASRLVCTLGLSLFVAGLGTGPMILSPLSEFYGRRPIYICSFTFFLVWMIPCALARNMETMLVARFLDGLAGSAFLSVAGGTVGDMFGKHELSAPMMVYTASPFVGPEIGPLIGGFIVENTTWRCPPALRHCACRSDGVDSKCQQRSVALVHTASKLVVVWFTMLCLIVLFVPETYHPVLLRRKAIRLRAETGNPEWIAPIEKMDRSIAKTVLWSCIRPFQLLIFEPMCLNLCILSAILLGILYLFFGAFGLVFGNNHGFSISQLGLAFLGLLVGMLTGICTDPIWRRIYGRLVRQREEQGGEPGGSEPEFRLPSTIVGAWVVPIALFVPIIFSALFGIGVIWVYSGVFTFLVEAVSYHALASDQAGGYKILTSANSTLSMQRRLLRPTALRGRTLLRPSHYLVFRCTTAHDCERAVTKVERSRLPMGNDAARVPGTGNGTISNLILSIWQATQGRQSLCVRIVAVSATREHVAEMSGEGLRIAK